MKPRVQVSFSGGRTSALMSIMINQHWRESHDLIFTFANTGREHPDTLRFVDEIDRRYNLNVVWLEASIYSDRRKATGHKVVSYETASRDGGPFEAVVSKYGLPNQVFKICTRELKMNPMKSFIQTQWAFGTYETAIGIRMDETRRVSRNAENEHIIYPLVDIWPVDLEDVLTFFEDFEWNLAIPARLGNCVTCHRKSDGKLLSNFQEQPDIFDFDLMLDEYYSDVGPNYEPGPRKRYRLKRNTSELLAQFHETGFIPLVNTEGGCSESCEVYDTDENG